MKRRFALLVLIALAGCSDFSPSDELTAARKRWEEWGSQSYDLTVRRSCECLYPEATGPVLVRVRDGVVESRTYVVRDEPVDFSEAGLYPDVTGLFRLVADAIHDGFLAEVDYDPVSGHPVRVLLDYDGSGTGLDGEVQVTATLRAP